MTQLELLQEAERVTRLHNDAFLVEFLGAERAGLPPERVQELVEAGVLDPQAIEGWRVENLDPYEYIAHAGAIMDRATPAQRASMRDWTMEQWSPLVQARVEDLRTRTRAEAEAQMEPGLTVTVEVPVPTPQGGAVQVTAPAWMSTAERGAYARAVTRAGEYARGLGNELAEDLTRVAAEAWQGEQITREVDPVRRANTLQAIREELANTLATTRDARALAGALGDRVGTYAHNWLRIAQTELQAAHNEGRVLSALELGGEGARVARIPESGACDYCLGAFTENGAPRVFLVSDLVGNGVNVGRVRAQWLPTVFPMHPKCRCDTLYVPDGYRVTPTGALERPPETEEP